mgnify:CR=1 FL=1
MLILDNNKTFLIVKAVILQHKSNEHLQSPQSQSQH